MAEFTASPLTDPGVDPNLSTQVQQASLANIAARQAVNYTAATQPAQINLLTQGLNALSGIGAPASVSQSAPAAPSPQGQGQGQGQDQGQSQQAATGGGWQPAPGSVSMLTGPTPVSADPTTQKYVGQVAAASGVNPDWAMRVHFAESGNARTPFGAGTTSEAGAIGPMQLMPGTAQALGVDPTDFQQNIQGGVQYLAQLKQRYQSPVLATAAYNAGPGRVDAFLAGKAPLPTETVNYIGRVFGTPNPMSLLSGAIAGDHGNTPGHVGTTGTPMQAPTDGLQPTQQDATAAASVRQLLALRQVALAQPNGTGMRAVGQIQAQLDNIAGPGGVVGNDGTVYRVPGSYATRYAASQATEAGRSGPAAALYAANEGTRTAAEERIAAERARLDVATHQANATEDTWQDRIRARTLAPGDKLVTPAAVGVGGAQPPAAGVPQMPDQTPGALPQSSAPALPLPGGAPAPALPSGTPGAPQGSGDGVTRVIRRLRAQQAANGGTQLPASLGAPSGAPPAPPVVPAVPPTVPGQNQLAAIGAGAAPAPNGLAGLGQSPQPAAAPAQNALAGLGQPQTQDPPGVYTAPLRGVNPAEIQTQIYKEDRDNLQPIVQQGQDAQAAQIRTREMRDAFAQNPSGPGASTKANLVRYAQAVFGDGFATDLAKKLTGVSDLASMDVAGKLGLVTAGAAERKDLGARGSLGALTLYSKANPNIELQPDAIKRMANMQLIAQQADADFAAGAMQHVNGQGQALMSGRGSYMPMTTYDQAWQASRPAQVYAGAMGALNGDPYAKWSAALSPQEQQRALAIVARADPTARYDGPNGPAAVTSYGTTQGAQQPAQPQPQARPQQQAVAVPQQLATGAAPSGGSFQDAIALLRQHPETAAQFDARYGGGAARGILGQ